LERLEKTYDFKQSLEYASPQAKEASLKSLKEKIDHIKEQIANFKQRVENYKEDICPICYDEPTDALLTPCCTHVFCATCIFSSMQRNIACPMCRAGLNPAELKKIVLDGAAAGPGAPEADIVLVGGVMLVVEGMSLRDLVRPAA
jgi:hypothetical protein